MGCFMKKLLCLFGALVLVFASVGFAFAAPAEFDDFGEAYYSFNNLPVFISNTGETMNAMLVIYAAPGSSVTIPYYEPQYYESDMAQFIAGLDLENTYVEDIEPCNDSIIIHFYEDIPEVLDDEDPYYPLLVDYPGKAFTLEDYDDPDGSYYYGTTLLVACYDYDWAHNEGSTFGSLNAIEGPTSYDYSSIIDSFVDDVDQFASSLTGVEDDLLCFEDLPSSFGAFPSASNVPGSSVGSSNGVIEATGSVFSTVIGFVSSVVETITSNPLLLIFAIVSLVGLGVGMTKRIMNL